MSEDVARPTKRVVPEGTRLPLADCDGGVGLTSSGRVWDCVMLCSGAWSRGFAVERDTPRIDSSTGHGCSS